METHRTNMSGYIPAMVALVSVVYFSLPVFAQVADGQPPADVAAPGSRSDADSGQGKTSDLFFAAHDVSGKLGTPLPLEIKLVRTGRVSIESILLLVPPEALHLFEIKRRRQNC